MANQEAADLNGKRIVVVEDDFLLAADICRELRDLGATVLGPAPTPFYAMQLVGRRKIDAAILDVRLHGTTVFEVADMLEDRGVPILFATGSSRDVLPARFNDARLLEKPLNYKRLVSELVTMTRRPASVPTNVTPFPTAQIAHENPVQGFARALARTLNR